LRRLKKRLDAVDLEILRILARDCRVEVNRLAKAVGLSVPSVRRRLRYLEASGILRGCYASIDAASLGVYTMVIRFYSERPEDVLDVVRGDKSVEGLYYSSGRRTGFIVARVSSTIDAEDMAEQIRRKGASQVEVFIVDSVLLERPWEPGDRVRGVITYRCRFCGAPIVGKPYTVRVGDEMLIFTNKRCADAYFALEHRGGRP